MRCILKVDRDDVFKSMELKELSAVEALTISHALRLLIEDEESKEADRRTAEMILRCMMNKDVQRPIEAIDGADLTDCAWK